ncbi:response regulator transcription factor [Luteolibacter arcticus]|uniref:Response regulator transcription factor n=1 Tax=Luteolibacter arcticus TaxID=1581411 RepID=A0ABT3GQB3_9BACT|nr:response regulator transcription factor [Luteolibacter arcticus]MCW1925709.1 response regulator transcription factor [Luteolibacter arcticus]
MSAVIHAPKHVCLIEDHLDYRRVLRNAINSSEHLRCELVFSSIEAFIAETETGSHVDVVLLDLGLPGMHGVAGIDVIQRRFPNARILVLTVYDHKPIVLEALAAGAGGYLLKSDRLEIILHGIDEALAGGAPLNSHIARMILSTFNTVKPERPEIDLSDRERETLAMLAKGLIKKEIADQLKISYHTVDTHVRNIYAKLKVHNLSGAVTKAIKLGLT